MCTGVIFDAVQFAAVKKQTKDLTNQDYLWILNCMHVQSMSVYIYLYVMTNNNNFFSDEIL